MARAAAPRFRGLRVATSTTRRLSNSAGAGNGSFYAAKVPGLSGRGSLKAISARDVIEMMTASDTEETNCLRQAAEGLTMDWEALVLTLKLDLVVCVLLLLIGAPI